MEIEVKKIRETTLTLCSKNLSLELSEQKTETPKTEVKNSEIFPTKENLTGHWKDDESDFWLFETGDYKIQYYNGKSAKGNWKINGDLLSLYKDKFIGKSEKNFKILIYTNDKFVYQSLKSKSDTFTAKRVK